MTNPVANNGEPSLRQIDIVKIYNDKSCLVVDDFPEIRGSLTRMLKIFGVERVDTAADGQEAINLCYNNRYDIVLCDYNLGPGKDGQQFLEEVRYLDLVPMTSLFIMITAEASSEMVLGALECQPDDYITKPYTQASLKLRLDRAIIRHMALFDIKKAITKKDYPTALDLCNQAIKENSRYAVDCLKIKAQLHLLNGQFDDAGTIYQGVVNNKPAVWAKLGMGKMLLGSGKLQEAKAVFEEIIEQDSRYIEAHDLLSEVHTQLDQPIQAQHALQNGTRISPKSVQRHRRLAELAVQNHDDETALRSYQQAIRWGVNSCLESEQDYFNYVRKAAEMIKHGVTHEASAIEKQAKTFLDRVRKRNSGKAETQVQALMAETQLYHAKGDNHSQEIMAQAVKAFEELPLPALETHLEYARTLYSMGREEEAVAILTPIAERYESHPDIIAKIDSITAEPVSASGKRLAAQLTKEGIAQYEQKNFNAAIQTFSEALSNYPRHIGLNLNLIQTVTAFMESAEAPENKDVYLPICAHSLRIAKAITPKHSQYQRYTFLTSQIYKHFPELES